MKLEGRQEQIKAFEATTRTLDFILSSNNRECGQGRSDSHIYAKMSIAVIYR